MSPVKTATNSSRKPSPHDFCRSLQHSGTGKMLVLPEYRAIVKRIANLYRQLPDSEVLITGQPGIGKSVFLFYLLAILLSIPMATSRFINWLNLLCPYTPRHKVSFTMICMRRKRTSCFERTVYALSINRPANTVHIKAGAGAERHAGELHAQKPKLQKAISSWAKSVELGLEFNSFGLEQLPTTL
ncbi:hypothetical protein BDP27DRAFT_1532831 [Rhodocollybia butyracea]|uniref:Uncharacterized protein n=1 Tax=Rhodocollybia butyracea TaxID=206335 RepID=A0A9P5P4N2_9AGAR|nr:hypothetical protein BDP27DRAFT_1532831 [Rhodocollybia butyracea]